MVSFNLEYNGNYIAYGTTAESLDIDPTSSYFVTHDTVFSDYIGFSVVSIGTGSKLSSVQTEIIDSYANSVRWGPNDYVAMAPATTAECAIANVSDPNNISVWGTLTQAGNTINDVAWSPDGAYLAYASADGNTYIHDNDPANNFPFVTSLNSTGSSPRCVIFSYDSNWMIAGEGDANVVYDTADWSLVNSNSHSYSQDDITINPSDSYIFHTANDSETATEELAWTDSSDWLTALEGTGATPNAFHHTPNPNYDLLSYAEGSDSVIKDVSDINSWVTETTLTDAGNTVNDVRFSDDGSWFAAASADKNIYVYSVTYAAFSGTVTDTNSNAIEGATVYAINDNDGSITGTATTAADGSYSIDGEDTTTEHHLIVQYDDGTTKYNGLSKPYVTAVEL